MSYLPFNLSRACVGTDEVIRFSRVLALNEMQSANARIWTGVTYPISYDDKPHDIYIYVYVCVRVLCVYAHWNLWVCVIYTRAERAMIHYTFNFFSRWFFPLAHTNTLADSFSSATDCIYSWYSVSYANIAVLTSPKYGKPYSSLDTGSLIEIFAQKDSFQAPHMLRVILYRNSVYVSPEALHQKPYTDLILLTSSTIFKKKKKTKKKKTIKMSSPNLIGLVWLFNSRSTLVGYLLQNPVKTSYILIKSR